MYPPVVRGTGREDTDAIAVTFEEQQLTYRMLNQRSDQLAIYLQAKGVKPDELIGIYINRSVSMVVGLLGILKAGGAYVAMDPLYPKDRLRYMLEDSKISIVITQKSLLKSAATSLGTDVSLCAIDSEWSKIADIAVNGPNFTHDVKPHNLAYVIYTSGSTGKPKGVMVNHGNIVNTLYSLETRYPVEKTDAYVLKTNYIFDVSLTELFGWFSVVAA